MPSPHDLDRPPVAILQTYLRPCRVPLLEGLGRECGQHLTLILYGAMQRRRLWKAARDLHDVEIHMVRNLQLPVSYEKSFFLPTNLQRTLYQINPAVVIGSFDLASVIASAWCRRNSRPFVIWSEETSATLDRSGRHVRYLRRWARRLQLSRASACIVPGRQSYEHIQAFGYKGPIFAGPNSIENEQQFAELGQLRMRLPYHIDAGLRVLFAGSLLPNKGIDVLVEHWEELTSGSSRPILLDVAGTGPLAERLQESKHPRIRFHGHLLGGEYRDLFRRAHAFILPSRADPNPLVVIEALWAGLPLIISSGVGSWPEAVGNNGFVIRPSDLGSVRRALIALADKRSDELLDMSRESVDRAQNFSTASAVEGFRKALLETV